MSGPPTLHLSPPPPLSLRPMSHPLYAQALALAVAGSCSNRSTSVDNGGQQPQQGIIWDVGCGFGKDLLVLAQQGVPPSQLVGIDTEGQFRDLALAQARAAGYAALPYAFLAVDLFADPPPLAVNLPPRPTVVLAYRVFHLFPADAHAQMLATLLALLDTSGGPAMVLGLHRSDVGDFARVLERAAVEHPGGQYSCELLQGPTEARSAVQWSFECRPRRDAATESG